MCRVVVAAVVVVVAVEYHARGEAALVRQRAVSSHRPCCWTHHRTRVPATRRGGGETGSAQNGNVRHLPCIWTPTAPRRRQARGKRTRSIPLCRVLDACHLTRTLRAAGDAASWPRLRGPTRWSRSVLLRANDAQ